jgi:hypothetical protein
MGFARSREKKNFRFFSLLFASNFSLPTKAKLIEHIFALFRFQIFLFRYRSFRFASKRNEINIFLLFSLNFIFVSLQMRKQAKKHFFRIEAKNFASILLRSESDGIFRFCFTSLRFEAKIMADFASVLLHFASK